jgi:hypothetical protein
LAKTISGSWPTPLAQFHELRNVDLIFLRDTVVNAQHIAEVVQQSAINNVGFRVPLDLQKWPAELRD